MKLLDRFDEILFFKKKFFLIFCLFLLAYPVTVSNLMKQYGFFGVKKIINLIVYFIILLKLIVIIRKTKKSPYFLFAVLIYYFIKGLTTYLNGYSIVEYFLWHVEYSHLALIVLFYCELENQNTKNSFLAASFYFEVYIYANIISIFFLGKNLSGNYLLDYDNFHGIFYLVGLTCLYCNSVINRKKIDKIRFLLMLVLTTIVSFYLDTSTTKVTFLILIILLILESIKNNPLFNSLNAFVVYILGFFCLTIFRIQNLFSNIMMKYLGRDAGLTGRTKIWDEFLARIKNKLLLGYGNINESIVFENFGGDGEQRIFMAHNAIIQELYNGGVLQAILFYGPLYLGIYKLYKQKEEKTSQVISIFVFALLITQLLNPYTYGLYLGMYLIAYEIDNILLFEEK